MENEQVVLYKIAWDKLTQLLSILDKADCPALSPGDVLRLMAFFLCGSVNGAEASRPRVIAG